MRIVRSVCRQLTCLVATAAMLTLAAPGLASAQGSDRTGPQLTVGLMKAFYSDKSEGPESSFGGADAIQGELKFDLDRALTAVSFQFTLVPDGWWPWPWPWDHSLPMDHNGGLRFTVNGFVDVAESGPLNLDAVFGAGIRRLGEGDGEIAFSPELPASEVYRIQSDIDPIVTYGVVADYAVGDRVILQANARGVTTFGGDLEVKDAAGASTTVEDRRQSFVNVGVGVGFRLGSGR